MSLETMKNKIKKENLEKVGEGHHGLGELVEIQSQLISLRLNADRLIKLINWHCK